MTDAIIRPRRDDDIPALARVLVEIHQRDGYPVEGVADPEAWLQLTKPIGAWTAELDGQPVGHIACTEPGLGDDAARMLHEQQGTPFDQIAVLGRLFVAPAVRGHRLGSRLARAAVKAAHANNRRAVLDVMAKDETAIAMYEQFGCVALGRFLHHHPGGHEPAVAFALPPQFARLGPGEETK